MLPLAEDISVSPVTLPPVINALPVLKFPETKLAKEESAPAIFPISHAAVTLPEAMTFEVSR